MEVNFLQYADDTKPMLQNVITIKSIHRCFELASDLKVIFFKSKFGSIGVDVDEMEKYAHFLNCKILHFPFTYFGILIGANPG